MPLHRPSQKSERREGLSLTGALGDCLACGVVVVSRRERIIACTAEAERMLRLRRGASGAALPALPARLRKMVREVISTNKPVTDRSVVLPAAGRASSALRVCAVPVASPSDKLQVVVVLNDIAAARRLEQDMRRLDRLASVGTLSASMAHEIKNALVAVKTFVDLLLEKNRDAELTDVVRRELRRIDSIVSQMLRFAGPARPAFSAVRLSDILDQSLRMVKHQLESKLISLNRAFNAAPDLVKGDDYQLEQAFLNLLLNAVEAMGPNGALTVATELVPSAAANPPVPDDGGTPQVRVIIADTGIGIAPENMNRLFEPFFSTKQHGTGLGLPIAQRIVHEHSGAITVQSEVNKGTTFSILLPAHAKAR